MQSQWGYDQACACAMPRSFRCLMVPCRIPAWPGLTDRRMACGVALQPGPAGGLAARTRLGDPAGYQAARPGLAQPAACPAQTCNLPWHGPYVAKVVNPPGVIYDRLRQTLGGVVPDVEPVTQTLVPNLNINQ